MSQKELYVIPGCFKCISGINLSPANKCLFTIAFILFFYKKPFIKGKSLEIDVFTTVKLLNTLASCSLRNFNFLQLQTKHFNKSIILLFIFFTTSGFLLSKFLV